jgi:hypothetical protein
MTNQAQVAVIGGGIVGASVLYHLAKLGWTHNGADAVQQVATPRFLRCCNGLGIGNQRFKPKRLLLSAPCPRAGLNRNRGEAALC